MQTSENVAFCQGAWGQRLAFRRHLCGELYGFLILENLPLPGRIPSKSLLNLLVVLPGSMDSGLGVWGCRSHVVHIYVSGRQALLIANEVLLPSLLLRSN